MGELSYKSTLLTRYLLGELSPAEQDSLEERFFIEDDLFIELLDTKDQLISDYLGQRLAARERARFERHFLSQPDCRHEVELAYFLQTAAGRQPLTARVTPSDAPRSWWRTMFDAWRDNWALTGATTAALIAVTITCVWLMTRTTLEKAPSTIAAPTTTATSGSATFTVELSPGLTRSAGGAAKVVLPPGTPIIKLNLAAGAADFSGYQAKLLRLDEGAVEIQAGGSPKLEQPVGGGRIVTWEIPAAVLPRGDYQVKLYGVSASNDTESIGTYYFKVRDE